MCGICGAIAVDDAERVVARMSQRLTHRGPDDEGILTIAARDDAPVVALGHRRLSIIDLSASGHQPMSDGGGRFTITYNGEIYNYQPLRASLVEEGVVFRGASDTEVILEGFARHGQRFLADLRGMFALSIWDRQRRELLLARDRFGIKPLYFARCLDGLIFASEVRALLASDLVPRRIGRDAVAAFLETGSVPEPLTAIAAIEPIAAGSAVVISRRDGRIVTTASQFAAPFDETDRTVGIARAGAASIREAVRDSIRRHLVSDVEVGAFLSGGIDSAVVVALAQEARPRALRTFTVSFVGQDPNEARAAQAVAEKFGTSHEVVTVDGEHLTRAASEAMAAMDQPTIDGLNTFVISRAVRERGLKVALSGLGGDEVFGGYPSFRRALRLARGWRPLALPRRLLAHAASRSQRLAAVKLALLLGGATPARGAYRSSRAVFGPEQVERLCHRHPPDPLPSPPPGLDTFDEVSYFELCGYMRNTLLRDSDVFSMAHGLELRVPFVDVEVLRAARNVDPALKCPGKTLLIDAARDLLPRIVWDRPKQGFTLPFAEWLRSPGFAGMLSAEPLARVGIDARQAERVWRDFLDGRVSWSRPWALSTLARWAQANDVVVEETA